MFNLLINEIKNKKNKKLNKKTKTAYKNFKICHCPRRYTPKFFPIDLKFCLQSPKPIGKNLKKIGE